MTDKGREVQIDNRRQGSGHQYKNDFHFLNYLSYYYCRDEEQLNLLSDAGA